MLKTITEAAAFTGFKMAWFSRHQPTVQQQCAFMCLQDVTGDDGYPSQGLSTCHISSVNMVFPATSEAAAREIVAHAVEIGADCVGGVFPSHVAISLHEACKEVGLPLIIPVSVPAPAVEGEVRGGGFVHSHLELFGADMVD